ncbi:unnamed protein product [Laminaria digitata]
MNGPTKGSWLGKSLPRAEDQRLTTGKGSYFADVESRDAVHLWFVRSVHAHARIVSIDTSAAEAMEGVVAVVTGDEMKRSMKSLPIPTVLPSFDARYPEYWALATEKVRWHGEPVAAVLATDKYLAEDAAEAVVVEYDPLPPVLDPEAALEADSPKLYEDWPDNEIFALGYTGGFEADGIAENDKQVDAIFANAPHVLKERFKTHRCGVCPIETRGAMAQWSETEGMTVWLTTQRPHIERLALADLFDIPTTLMRVVAPRDQGGGFGVKAPFYREHIVVCFMAKKLGRTVRWVETREEHLMTVSQERDQIHDLEIAADNDGKILAIRDRGVGDIGDGRQGVYWGFVMPNLGAAMLPNAYNIPIGDIKIRCAVTNKTCLSPSRSFGALPTRFAMERALDMLARRIGMETAELKRRNLVSKFPYDSITGVHMDTGDFVAAWDKLIEHVDLKGVRAKQKVALKEGRHIGVGFACGAEFSGVPSAVLVPLENQPGYGVVNMRIDPRGKVLIYEGDAPTGQGHETTMAQVAAHEFGINPSDVIIRAGDTEKTPLSSGTIGARGASYTMAAISQACRALKEKMARFVIHDMKIDDAEPDDFEFVDGFIVLKRDSNLRQPFAETADRIIMRPIDLPAGETGGLEHTAYFESDMPMICFTCQAAVVEVDAETGQFEVLRYLTVEDVGTVINPSIVEGQVQGGVIQGMSNAMFEEFVYDENGQQLTADFENYRVASAADVPHIEVNHAPTPCEQTPLGIKAVGEGRPGPVPGALANAICDALSPLGVEITSLPLRPQKILEAIEAART